jgi:hypothetical protein
METILSDGPASLLSNVEFEDSHDSLEDLGYNTLGPSLNAAERAPSRDSRAPIGGLAETEEKGSKASEYWREAGYFEHPLIFVFEPEGPPGFSNFGNTPRSSFSLWAKVSKSSFDFKLPVLIYVIYKSTRLFVQEFLPSIVR